MKDITTNELNEILEKKANIVIDFYTKWCGPCKIISPYLENISYNLTEYEFYKYDVEQDNQITAIYNIKSVPTIIIFLEGKEVARKVGFATEKDLFNWLKNLNK